MQADMLLIEDAAYCIAMEFARFGTRADALNEMADYVDENSSLSVWNGPKMLTPKEAAERKRQIERLAARVCTENLDSDVVVMKSAKDRI
jgi:hypothetical protein